MIKFIAFFYENYREVRVTLRLHYVTLRRRSLLLRNTGISVCTLRSSVWHSLLSTVKSNDRKKYREVGVYLFQHTDVYYKYIILNKMSLDTEASGQPFQNNFDLLMTKCNSIHMRENSKWNWKISLKNLKRDGASINSL